MDSSEWEQDVFINGKTAVEESSRDIASQTDVEPLTPLERKVNELVSKSDVQSRRIDDLSNELDTTKKELASEKDKYSLLDQEVNKLAESNAYLVDQLGKSTCFLKTLLPLTDPPGATTHILAFFGVEDAERRLSQYDAARRALLRATRGV